MGRTSTTFSAAQSVIETVLAAGDIEINGSRPWDITVHDERFYHRVLKDDTLGMGESYMEEWWEAEELDAFFAHLLRVDLKGLDMSWRRKWTLIKERYLNRQSRHRALLVGEHHYDRGNDLFRVMLDRRMTYTCGYWKDIAPVTGVHGDGVRSVGADAPGTPTWASPLDAAQEAKLDLVCRKLGLKSGQRILDIGCGWGSFMKYAAEKYGIEAVGMTVSKEQVALGRELCAGLPIEILLQDYREITGEFDHVVSLGMFEHVGTKNYRTFFETAGRCLNDDGLLLVHTIGNLFSDLSTDPFTEKYIFPNGVCPSIRQIGDATERLFVMEDWHNIGPHYDPTLMAWCANFESGWDALQERYGETFYRMWRYFLLASAGAFRSRMMQVWQIVFSKSGVVGGYAPVR